MTGDDHANGGTVSRFNQYLGFGNNTAQDVQDWRAIRGTSYIYSSFSTGVLSDAQASSFNAQGFEISLHLNTGCFNYSQSSLLSDFTAQFPEFTGKYPSLQQSVTHRTHCLAWSDWSFEAEGGEPAGHQAEYGLLLLAGFLGTKPAGHVYGQWYADAFCGFGRDVNR